MKKKFWTGRLKTILIVALIIAICAAVTLAITNGTSAIENVVGTILSPIRAGVASIDRLAERYYNYMFRYESLAAENAKSTRIINFSRRTSFRGIPPTIKAPLPSARARTRGWRRVCAP